MDRAKLAAGLGAAAAIAGLAYAWVYASTRPDEVHRYAVGAKDEVVAPYPCTLEGAPPFLTVEEWGPNAWGTKTVELTALGPGVARFACKGVTYVAEIRAPASVAIEAPAAVPMATRFAPRLFARDAGGVALEVGRHADIAWSIDGAARSDNRGSCEFPPWCGSPPAGATWVVGTSVGTARVTARFGGFEASATIAITPNPDASAAPATPTPRAP